VVFANILDAIGGTPLVKLNRVVPPEAAEVLVKVEALGVGGSIKTRTAWNMVREAMARGQITDQTIIAEPTSGNQGVGLALVGAVLGLKVIVVMPDSVSAERRLLAQAYGAEVHLIHDAGDIGAAIDECLAHVAALAAADPRVFVPQQFVNPDNPAVHRDVTAQEILAAVDGPIDGFCAGVGTGGTLTGIGRALRARYPEVVIWAVEPAGAAILTGGTIGSHLQMGIGDGLIPENLDTNLYDDVAVVDDDEAIAMTRQLASQEGLLGGISSGTNVVAAIRLARRLGPGKRVVTIAPDTGERYFSTPLYD